MKKLYTLLFFLFINYLCNAQTPEVDDGGKVEGIKRTYMSKELKLTPQEAQNFWPVYDNYQTEIKQARNQDPDNEVEFEKKVVEIKQRYQENFKTVLGDNSKRINKVYTTDKQFNNTLRNELKNRQQKQTQGNPQQQQVRPRQLQQQNNGGAKPNKNNTIKRGNGANKRPRPNS